MRTLRTLMCALLVVSLAGASALAAEPGAKAAEEPAVVDTETQPAVNPIWHTLKTWTVSGSKTTESFTIDRSPWRVRFECEEGGKGAVLVNSGDETVEVISGASKTSYVYGHDGEYYLKIISPESGTIHVEVQQLGGKAAAPMRQLIASYLDKMGYVYTIDETDERSEISLTMRGENNRYDLRIFIDDSRKVVYVCVNRFLTCPTSHPRLAPLLQRLMELNWQLLIGKYEWDKTDGEVRLSHTFSTENGLGYDAFVACFQLLVMTADNDYPALMKLMWGGEVEGVAEAVKPKPKTETTPRPELKAEPKPRPQEEPTPEATPPPVEEETEPEPAESEEEPESPQTEEQAA